jgi:CRP-like cAMP-binding protein
MILDSRRSGGERYGGAGLAESHIAALLASLERRDHVSAEERVALEKLGWRFKDCARSTEIIHDRSRPFESCLLIDGYAARVGYLRSGRRQLSAIHLAGDFVDLHGLLLKILDHSVIALTDCRVAFVEHSELQKLVVEQPHLWRLLSLMMTIDSAIQRSWLISLGRRNPTSRLAHLICEIYLRLEVVGKASNYEFEFRVGQAELADMLGLSVVHTNRTLQELRSHNLLTWRNGVIRILDWNALANLAEFDPTYLNLFREPR